ncbi:MAG: hypothetical protein ACO1NW_03740 [Chitinophagaceae bacterium]
MFNNTAIEVFIGLISIYLLYSLLATILMEALAKFMGLRARNTLKAISKLLDDSSFSDGSAIDRLFSGQSRTVFSKSFKGRPFTALFYAHPNIKNLGSNNFYRKPSDISAELFSETLAQLLRGDAFKGDENQVQLIANSLEPEPTGSAVLPIPAFYAHEKVGHTELGAAPAEVHIHPLTTYQLRQFVFESHSDIAQLKARFILWYNQIMERATGWYIKQTRIILFFIGFILAIAFRINTIAIADSLSTDDAARSYMMKFAEKISGDSNYRSAGEKLPENFFNNLQQLNPVLSANKNNAYWFPGYFLTACAISLGSAFWFDLLKKIMSIRQAGKTTEPTLTQQKSAETTVKIIG